MTLFQFLYFHWFFSSIFLISLFCNVLSIYLALKWKDLYLDLEQFSANFDRENATLLQKVHKQETTIAELERRNNKLKKELEKVKDDSKRDERASD